MSKKNSSSHYYERYVAAMGLWSYSQLTSLHLAFIKLLLSKFVAPESRGRLLPKPNSLTKSSNAPGTFRYGVVD